MGLGECPVCGTQNISLGSYDIQSLTVFYNCPTCGRYELSQFNRLEHFNKNRIPSYLFYNRFIDDSSQAEYKYHTIKPKDFCDSCNEAENGDIRYGHPVHMDNVLIDVWYPKTFSERVDYITKYLGNHIEHIGQEIKFSSSEMLSLLFVDRFEMSKSVTGSELVKRPGEACNEEAKYMLDSIAGSGIIEYTYGVEETEAVFIRLTPKGYARVDELQKNAAYGKAVLVAMKFGDDTKALREAIRAGIAEAGYIAEFIDEVPHNNFITPELLKHIRDSKFVVVDLTHQNNGAYFEEGYAMGLGKPVIQLCNQDTKLHFDIAQKNTIMWQTEDEIPERLCNRIKATIN